MTEDFVQAATPMIPLEDFKPRKGMMSRYAKKVINNSMYGKISGEGFITIYDPAKLKKAQNPKTTKPTLSKLAETTDKLVHIAICVHPKTNAKILHKVWTNTDDQEVKDLILDSDKLTPTYRELIELGLA